MVRACSWRVDVAATVASCAARSSSSSAAAAAGQTMLLAQNCGSFMRGLQKPRDCRGWVATAAVLGTKQRLRERQRRQLVPGACKEAAALPCQATSSDRGARPCARWGGPCAMRTARPAEEGSPGGLPGPACLLVTHPQALASGTGALGRTKPSLLCACCAAVVMGRPANKRKNSRRSWASAADYSLLACRRGAGQPGELETNGLWLRRGSAGPPGRYGTGGGAGVADRRPSAW